MRLGSGARDDVFEEDVGPGWTAGEHLEAAAAERGILLMKGHRIVIGVVRAGRTVAADAPRRTVVLHLRQDLCVRRWSWQHSAARQWWPNLDQSDFRSFGIALRIRRDGPEKMLAGGHADRRRNVS